MITGNSSYLPTLDEFIPHWTGANTALGASGPLVLADGLAVAGLTALRATLATRRTAVESARNAVEGSRADISALKASLLARINQFGSALASVAPDSRWTAMRPKAFGMSDAPGKVLDPLDDMADVWDRYEAAASALTLADDYGLPDFQAELAALKAAFLAHRSAGNGLKGTRADRDATQAAAYAGMKAYRAGVAARFAEGSPVLATLPRLTPPPGSTPDAPTLTGAFDAAEGEFALGWSEVVDASVAEVELRATAGPEYDAEDEAVVASFAPGAPREWSGPFGGNVPGTAVSMRLYALTAHGNERGSNSVTMWVPS